MEKKIKRAARAKRTLIRLVYQKNFIPELSLLLGRNEETIAAIVTFWFDMVPIEDLREGLRKEINVRWNVSAASSHQIQDCFHKFF